jgi:hypothetical protein
MQTITVARYVSICAVAFTAVSLLAACSQNSGSPMLPSSALLSAALPQAVPPCKGQKTTKEYAYITETLSSKGGDLCIPAFGGFGGGLPYAPANPPVKIKLTTSTTNYNHKLPRLGKGPPLLYGQFAFGGTTTFGKKADGHVTFTGVKIVSGKAYTLFGQFIVDGKKMNLKACYAIASKGKHGGIFDAGGPLVNQSISEGTTLIGEVDLGEQTGTKCL